MRLMDVDAFLKRIGYAGAIAPSEDTLKGLHRAFVTAVPFENLDIHLGRRIVLDEAAFFDKIVAQKRGGFCYELNGLFAAVLRELGFDVTLLSARVFDGNGDMGREFVHLTLLVTLDKRWIADVGFGDWAAEPLWLDTEAVQPVDRASFRVMRDGQRYGVEKKDESDGGWKRRYSFELTPRRLSEFSEICADLQTAEDSFFRRHRMCTRCTPQGRLTLTEDKLIVTADGARREIAIEGEGAYRQALLDHFGIVLGEAQV